MQYHNLYLALKRILSRRKENQQRQLFLNRMESVLNPRRHEDHSARLDGPLLLRNLHHAPPQHHVVSLILPVRLLRVLRAHAQMLDSQAHLRHAQELQVRELRPCPLARHLLHLKDVHNEILPSKKPLRRHLRLIRL